MISQYLILPTNQIYLNVLVWLVKIVCVRKPVKKMKVWKFHTRVLFSLLSLFPGQSNSASG